MAEEYIQKQTLSVGSGLVSSKETHLFFLMLRNYQFSWIKRLILDPQISTDKFKEIKSYIKSS